MKQQRLRAGSFVVVFLAAIILLVICTGAEAAGYKTEVLGIKVSYSLPGCFAFYDVVDDTITINITQSGGRLKVTPGKTATFWWPEGWSDIFINAAGMHLAKMSFTGKPSTLLFVCGQVGSCLNFFAIKNGAVGATDFYGLLVGLEATTFMASRKIIVKNGLVTGSLLGPPLGFLVLSSPVPGPSSAPGVEPGENAAIKGLLQAEAAAMDPVEKEEIAKMLQDGAE
jgi:hypothetical protein